jgi:predicted GIY-YIG superfamily endonuclease
MPKREIDYSNTIIYKLICKDKSTEETYIGHTTNFVQRKYIHKTACAKGWNVSTTSPELVNIYSTILRHGGWSNWDMIDIAKCACKDKKEAIQKENEYRSVLRHEKKPGDSEENLSTKQEQTSKYFCEACKYNTKNRTDFAKHEMTSKHKANLSKHVSTVEPVDAEYKLTGKESMKEILSEVIRQNNQQNASFIENFTENFTEKFMEKFMEMSKQSSPSITNNTTNNNTVNNQFNLNVFLNEKCKNALNLADFINTLHVQVSDLVNTGKVGFVEGITTILLNKLRAVDIYKRPLHCTDVKREIVYVKNANIWEKESDDKTNMKRLVNIVARKNLAQLSRWAEENPDFLVLDSNAYNEYIQIGMNSTGGTVEQQEKNIEKVITNVLKSVAIDKQQERLSNDNSDSL